MISLKKRLPSVAEVATIHVEKSNGQPLWLAEVVSDLFMI